MYKPSLLIRVKSNSGISLSAITYYSGTQTLEDREVKNKKLYYVELDEDELSWLIRDWRGHYYAEIEGDGRRELNRAKHICSLLNKEIKQ